jgi:hypothetical protein
MQTVDLKKQLKPLFGAPAASPIVVDVPAMKYLMIDGEGDPNTSPQFAAAVGALYSVAYTLKFSLKKAPEPIDFPVMPLEGLWWADDMSAFRMADRDAWKWTLMIVLPGVVTAAMVKRAVAVAEARRPNPEFAHVRLERFKEGRAAQLMHIGPYNTEGANIQRLHDFIAAGGGRPAGKHHEIYLSDMRRTPPEKLKTIIRQSFVRAMPIKEN